MKGLQRLIVRHTDILGTRGVLQPGVRGPLAAGLGHARDDVANSRSDLRSVQTERAEFVFEATLAHRLQRGLLHAHAARIHQFQRVQVDLLITCQSACFIGRAADGVAGCIGSGRSQRALGSVCGSC